MKKKRGKQHMPSLLAPLSDEELAHLMRDTVTEYYKSDIVLKWCDNCRDWEPRGSRDAGFCIRCLRHHDGSR